MKLTFDDIINKEKGKKAFICGLGNSLNAQKEVIIKAGEDKNNNVIISCNEWDVKAPWLPVDYWVCASTVNTVSQRFERFNAKKCTLIYEEGLDFTPRQAVAGLLKIDYLPYDQRHYNGICKNGTRSDGRNWCCNFYIPGRLTVMQELQKYTGYDIFYQKIDTVALNMTAMAILLGCNPIYIYGVDLDYAKPYCDGTFNKAMRLNSDNILKNYVENILESFRIIDSSALRIGVNIFSHTANSPINDIFTEIEINN